MLYEFEIVSVSGQELYNKNIQAELQGENSVNYYNENDFLSKYVLDVSRVVGFRQTKVLLNDQTVEAVSCEVEEGDHTPALVLPYELFKEIYLEVKGVEIKKVL